MKTGSQLFRATAATALMLLAAGCATLRQPVEKPVTTALPPATDTPSARYIQSELVRHAHGVSGFRLLTLSTNALLSRITLADHAEHSIDLQYYIFRNDATGRLVAQHLLAAADRGARVRLLLDDANLKDEREMLDALDSHPNVEVRVFNPFSTREPSLPAKLAQMLVEGSRLNRRMHNKSFIVDNKIAVVGGRNIGDDYFDASSENNFRDLDLVAIGPVVAEASRTFDDYWNSKAAFPVTAFADSRDKPVDLPGLRATLAKDSRLFAQSDYLQAAFDELPEGATADRRGLWFWGDAVLVADAPEKAESKESRRGLRMAPTLAATINGAQQELTLISPYFIPSDANVADLLALTGRGVAVRVLTNSLAATDEHAVYARYAPHRQPLLAGGVKLYELRPDAGPTATTEAQPGQSSGVSLHAKALVVDGHITFIGSMNLDPRSALVNTEMGLIVDNVALAKAVTDFFALATRPENSFELQLERDPGDTAGAGHLVWVVGNGSKVERVEDEPETSASMRLKMRLLRLLPIDGLL